MAVLAGKLREQTASTRDLALKSTYERLIKTLYDLSESSADNIIIRNIAHQRLADHIHSSREMVTRIIGDLKKGGYIEASRHQIIIKKRLPAFW